MSDEVTVQRWLEGYLPSEEDIRDIMREEDLNPYRWSNGPGYIYSAHSHGYHKVIYIAEGSITFGLPEGGKNVKLEVGDRLELPSGVTHDAVVGRQGVVCLEAHREV